MGSADRPPPHVPSHVVPLTDAFLKLGGSMWTLCYILLVLSSLRTKSYGMPLMALCINISWEIVYALYVSEEPLERTVFGIWLIMDTGLVYGVLKYAKHEWAHAPLVPRYMPLWLFLGVGMATAGHYGFAKWWIESEIGIERGKIFVAGDGTEWRTDTTELGFWSAGVSQVYLGIASIAQLVVRGHSGGVSWGVWGTRFLGSAVGFDLYYGWRWWFWTEQHAYFMTPVGMWLWSTGLLVDLAYPFVLAAVRRREVVLEDGRRVAPESSEALLKKRA